MEEMLKDYSDYIMDDILFEFPLNERIRTLMRLESLFEKAFHYAKNQSIWDAQMAVFSIIHLINDIERKDIRVCLLKELEKQHNTLKKLNYVTGVNQRSPEGILYKLENLLNHYRTGKIYEDAYTKHDELLRSVRLRLATSHTPCIFDLPHFHAWIYQNNDSKTIRLNQWLEPFKKLHEGIDFILSLMRNSSVFELNTTNNGFYQQSLDKNSLTSMIRIKIPQTINAYPEHSGSRHLINIRFLSAPTPSERPKQLQQNFNFKLSICY